jgi:hypothetical protein
MTANAKAQDFRPVVIFDANRRPMIVFKRGRTKYHAVAATESSIALVAADTLPRGFVYAMRNDEPYPVRRAASFWLNHDFRPVTKRAKMVLRGLVARKKTKENM